jgi:uncharacterized protein (DUF3084 family)
MRLLLRAMILMTLLFTGAALEVSQARAGDGFARYLQQQARFLARVRKPNTTRPTAKATTPVRKPAAPATGQRPSGRDTVPPSIRSAPR